MSSLAERVFEAIEKFTFEADAAEIRAAIADVLADQDEAAAVRAVVSRWLNVGFLADQTYLVQAAQALGMIADGAGYLERTDPAEARAVAAEASLALVLARLDGWLAAMETGRSEPLYIERDATRSVLRSIRGEAPTEAEAGGS